MMGKVGEFIIEMFRVEYVDLIIVGIRGMSKVWWIFLGSVSDYFVYYVNVFVFVCCYKEFDV